MPPDFKYPSQRFIDGLPFNERERFESLRPLFEQDYRAESDTNQTLTGFLRSSNPYAVQHGYDHFGDWLQREGYLGQQGLPPGVLRLMHEYKPEGWERLVEVADSLDAGLRPPAPMEAAPPPVEGRVRGPVRRFDETPGPPMPMETSPPISEDISRAAAEVAAQERIRSEAMEKLRNTGAYIPGIGPPSR